MINKFFVMKYADLYKSDSSFIYKVETVKSTGMKALSALPGFTIVRIFTKTLRNVISCKYGCNVCTEQDNPLVPETQCRSDQ